MNRSSLMGVVVCGLAMGFCGSAYAQSFANMPALSFTMPFAGANPLPQTLTVNSNSSAFNYSVASATTSGGTWLQVSPSGTDCCITPSSITVGVAPASPLNVGTYSGQIVFTKYGGTSATITVPVTLTVSASNTVFFDNLPGQVSFSLATDGNVPPSQFVQIRNAGSGVLNWTSSSYTADGGRWLTVSSAGGTAPSTLSVGIAPAALPGAGHVAGTFIGQLLLQTSGKSVSIPVSVTVGTEVFAQVNAVNFTKPFAGSDPLPQTLTIASTGNDFNIDVVAYNGAGGNWLTVSPSGTDCCVTPESLTVSAHPSPSLAAGTYTGEIVVTEYAGHGMAMTIPVTLTIGNPNTQPFFDNMPGQVSFSLKTNSTAPPGQAVQVRNAGAGTLNWTLLETTADGGKWLTASAASGTATSMVSIGINPANLPNGGHVAGTFVGQLVFQTPGDVVSIPVSVTVGTDVFEQVNGIDFTKPFAGANPLPQTLTIASAGADFNIDVSASTATGGNWLMVSPSGTDCCITPESLTVSVDPSASLAAGTYTGQIIVTKYSGNSMAMTIPVTLTIRSNSALFDNLPGQMSFFSMTGGNPPPSQPLQIRNAGTGTLNWTVGASTSDGGKWLTTSVASGTAPSTLSVEINKANLPGAGQIAGTFTGQLVFQTTGDIVTIPVSVIIGDNVFKQANPLNFTKVYGGANPLPQTVTVASTGNNFNISVSASTANGGNWLSVSPSGADCCITPEVLTVNVSPSASLAPGIYTGQVVVGQYSGNGMTMTVPVTLTVAANSNTAFFDNLPGQVSFSMKTGGSAPPKQPIQIRNGGSGTLDWTVSLSTSDGRGWLTVSTANGTAPSTVSVFVNPALLPGNGLVAGTFTGELVFQTAGDVVTVPVSVVVGDDVFEQVNALNFTKPYAGANPLPQAVTIASTGNNFNISVAASTANGGDWLTVSPSGLDCCITPKVLTIGVNPSPSLAAGTYTGQVVVSQDSGNGQRITIPVTLTVAPSTTAFFDNVQGQLSYSLLPGGANPASHTVQIRNGGTGTLNWTLATSTADGGKWIGVSSLSGSAPEAVTVSVDKTALPGAGLVAGLFTGQVLLQTAGDMVTIPVSVVVDPNAFQQLDSLTFSKSPGGSNPAAQTISISSLGVNSNLSVTGYTGNGGSWLTVSPSGIDCCVTPRTLTISVNPTASLPAGLYTGQVVVSKYSGNGMAMTIPVYLAVGVGPLKATSISVRSSVDPSNFGQAVTFTATVSAATTTGLSGTVTFYDGSTAIGSGTLSGTTATFTTAALTSGAHTISAAYGGNSTYSRSSSPTFTQNVGPGGTPTTTTLISSLNPGILGLSTVTFLAKVSGTGVTGTVTFKDGAVTLTTVPLSSGGATYVRSSLSAGAHPFTAVYNGASGFAPSTSPVLLESILVKTTMALSSSANPASSGHFLTLTATVSGTAAGQNGYVTFFDGGVPLSTVPLNGTAAVLSAATLAKGTHSIMAVYGGSSVYAGSSATGSQVVQ